MHIVNLHDAKTHFSKWVDVVLRGKEIIIAKAGKPVARLVPIIQELPKRRFGVLKGKIKIAVDFDAALKERLIL